MRVLGNCLQIPKGDCISYWKTVLEVLQRKYTKLLGGGGGGAGRKAPTRVSHGYLQSLQSVVPSGGKANTQSSTDVGQHKNLGWNLSRQIFKSIDKNINEDITNCDVCTRHRDSRDQRSMIIMQTSILYSNHDYHWLCSISFEITLMCFLSSTLLLVFISKGWEFKPDLSWIGRWCLFQSDLVKTFGQFHKTLAYFISSFFSFFFSCFKFVYTGVLPAWGCWAPWDWSFH